MKDDITEYLAQCSAFLRAVMFMSPLAMVYIMLYLNLRTM